MPRHWNATGDLYLLHVSMTPSFPESNPHDDAYPAGPEGQLFLDGQRIGGIDREHSDHWVRLLPGQNAGGLLMMLLKFLLPYSLLFCLQLQQVWCSSTVDVM